jgi:6-pyruvoyltetrahydropterin/6-carboxytetrahydropterin synthase
MFTLSKKFRFESAHRLAKGYEGKCANIHGHSWNGRITIEMPDNLDLVGMVVDYAVLGQFCKIFEERYDHKLLLWEGEEDLIEMLRLQNLDYVAMENNPTSEHLAKEICHDLKAYCAAKEIKWTSLEVTIEETCTTSCTYNIKK